MQTKSRRNWLLRGTLFLGCVLLLYKLLDFHSSRDKNVDRLVYSVEKHTENEPKHTKIIKAEHSTQNETQVKTMIDNKQLKFE